MTKVCFSIHQVLFKISPKILKVAILQNKIPQNVFSRKNLLALIGLAPFALSNFWSQDVPTFLLKYRPNRGSQYFPFGDISEVESLCRDSFKSLLFKCQLQDIKSPTASQKTRSTSENGVGVENSRGGRVVTAVVVEPSDGFAKLRAHLELT